jgi:pimeloyl-ACP methyl ester carboxylesterase
MSIAVLPDLSPARRRTIAVPGGEIAALEFGPADRPLDVVFLHANGFNAGTYRTILAPLADRLRILGVDQRGHGRTTLPAIPYEKNSWLGFRDDLLALLEALGETPTVLAGHSMGGTACILAAVQRADAARRLVLFDPVVVSPERVAALGPEGMHDSPLAQGARRRRAQFPSREAAFEAYLGRGAFRSWPEQMLRDYLADGLVEDAEGQMSLSCAPDWESSNFGAHFHDTVGDFPRVAAPIRILKAEIGSTCQLERHEADILALGVDLAVVPGTSHFLPMERPELVREALLAAI